MQVDPLVCLIVKQYENKASLLVHNELSGSLVSILMKVSAPAFIQCYVQLLLDCVASYVGQSAYHTCMVLPTLFRLDSVLSMMV